MRFPILSTLKGTLRKQNHYEHSIRVPLLFAGAGIPAGEQREGFCYLSDIYPTLCELSNIAIPSSVEGQSLLPMMGNREYDLRPTMYFAYNELIRSAKNHEYKLIEYVGKTRATQLFHLADDPAEVHNLYGDERYAGIVEQLRAEMAAYREAWDELEHPMGQQFWNAYGI